MSFIWICHLIATILGFLAAFGVSSPRFSTGWGAVAFIALGMVLGGFGVR